MDPLPPPDAPRTTPPGLRPFALAGLAAVAFYLLLCFRFALEGFDAPNPPTGTSALESILWIGRWRMFTDLRTAHTDLDLEVQRAGGDWEPVAMASLYPARWDEGPGYTRDAFLGDSARVAALAEDVCARTGGSAVRFTRVTFQKTPGAAEQPRSGEVRTPVLEATCGNR